MYEYNLYELIMMIVVISFCGFCIENTWLAITKGYMDNRNMHLPFLLGYGVIAVLFYLLIGMPKRIKVFGKEFVPTIIRSSYVGYFLLAMLLVSISEIALGTFIERRYGIICWDYTWLPLHFTRYTSILTSTGFSFMIIVFAKDLFEPIMNIIKAIPFGMLKYLSIFMLTLIICDCAVSFYNMRIERKINEYWHIDIQNYRKRQDERGAFAK